MLKKLKELTKENQMSEGTGINSISKTNNLIFNIILLGLSLAAIIPFIFVTIISLTDENVLAKNGYRFIPEKWSFYAYEYIFTSAEEIVRSFGVSIVVTILGTVIGLILTSTYAYALSRKTFAYRGFFTKLAFLPMLFSGGMVASYLVMVRFLGFKNTIWALILPICLNSFNIIVLRTFFNTSIPDSIVESAKIDGASEWRLFLQIVLPISLPGLATIGLFLTLGFWNDWFNAMLYVDNNNLIPLQYLLIRIESSVDFLANNASKMGLSGVEEAAKMPKETMRMAIVVLSTLPIMFAYPFFQKYFVNGLTIGAVKE